MDDRDRRLLSASIGLTFTYLSLRLVLEHAGKIVLIASVLAAFSGPEKTACKPTGSSPNSALSVARR